MWGQAHNVPRPDASVSELTLWLKSVPVVVSVWPNNNSSSTFRGLFKIEQFDPRRSERWGTNRAVKALALCASRRR